MTTMQIRERMESLRVEELDEMRSQLEVVIRDESHPEHKRNEARTAVRSCEDGLHKKNTLLDLQRIFGFKFDPQH